MLFIENAKVVVTSSNRVNKDSGCGTFGSVTAIIRAEIHRVRIIKAVETKSNIKKLINIIFGFALISMFVNKIDITKKRGG